MPCESNRPDGAFFVALHKPDPGHAVAAEFHGHAAHFLEKLVLIGRADHGLVASTHGSEDLAEPLVLFLRRAALGDVVQVNSDERLFASAGGKDMRIRGQSLPVAAQGFDFQAFSYRRAGGSFANGIADGPPQFVRQPAVLNRASEKRRSRTAKQGLGGRVEHDHIAQQVHADIGVRRAADDRRFAVVLLCFLHVPASPCT